MVINQVKEVMFLFRFFFNTNAMIKLWLVLQNYGYFCYLCIFFGYHGLTTITLFSICSKTVFHFHKGCD